MRIRSYGSAAVLNQHLHTYGLADHHNRFYTARRSWWQHRYSLDHTRNCGAMHLQEVAVFETMNLTATYS